MDFFDTGTIHCNLPPRSKVGGNFDIACLEFKVMLVFTI